MKIRNSRLLNSKFWIDMLWPNRCPVCGKVIIWDKLLCTECEKSLTFLDDPKCSNQKWDFGEQSAFDGVYSLFPYTGCAVGAIYNLKLNKGINFAEYSSRFLGKILVSDGTADKIDIVTCVPMSKKKKRIRGYNQAEKIAEFISKELNKPLNSRLLVRKDDKFEQHMLNSRQRHEHVQNIYDINCKGVDIKGKTILLCDDVITTGSTINKCAELLKVMGAKCVYAVSLCSTEFKGITER